MIARRSMALAVAFLSVAGAAFALTPVRILSPAPDSVVREQVPIKVPASAVPNTAPVPGYVVVAIDGKFQAAVTRPRTGSTVSYVWDTKAPTAAGDQGVPDGKHEIRVTAVSQDGQPVGNTDRIEVFVQNEVRAAPEQALLRYHFIPGVQHTYVQKIQIKQSDQEIFKARIVLLRNTDDVMPGDQALLRERIDRDSTQTDQGQPTPLPNAGQSVSFNVESNGRLTPGLKMRRTGEKPVLYLPILPGAPVKVNTTWNAPVYLAPMYQGMEGITLPADMGKYTLAGFEWQNGVPTAKITATFTGTAQTVVQGVPTLYRANGTRTFYLDWRYGRLIKLIDDYSIVQTDSGGNVTMSGPGGAGAPTGGPPTYSPYRGPYAVGNGGGGGSATDSTALKVTATTELNG